MGSVMQFETVAEPDKMLLAKCEALREFVDNINRAPLLSRRNGIYQALRTDQVNHFKADGWIVGYRLVDHPLSAGHMTRLVFLKAEQPLAEIPDGDRDRVMTAVLEVFCDVGVSTPRIDQVALDCIRIEQDFIPTLLVERNPGLVSISNMGSC